MNWVDLHICEFFCRIRAVQSKDKLEESPPQLLKVGMDQKWVKSLKICIFVIFSSPIFTNGIWAKLNELESESDKRRSKEDIFLFPIFIEPDPKCNANLCNWRTQRKWAAWNVQPTLPLTVVDTRQWDAIASETPVSNRYVLLPILLPGFIWSPLFQYQT